VDSGKTEEELFSAVVRTPSSIEQQQPSKGKPVQSSPVRDDNKQETAPDAPERSSPNPQRLQQSKRQQLNKYDFVLLRMLSVFCKLSSFSTLQNYRKNYTYLVITIITMWEGRIISSVQSLLPVN